MFKIQIHNVMKCTKGVVACLMLVLFLSAEIVQATEPVIKGKVIIEVKETGDSDYKLMLETPRNFYNTLKSVGNNYDLLARNLGMDYRHWIKSTDFTGQFVDAKNQIRVNYVTPGASRNNKGNRWIYSLDKESDSQVLNIEKNRISMMTTENTEIGLGVLLTDILLPENATQVIFDQNKREIYYNFEPEVNNGSHAELDFTFDHKSIIIGSLAKNYSNPDFKYLWAARGVAKNTGDQVLKNYKIRFRIAEFSSWSSWMKSAAVYPGQTVVDPFFPVIDMEKIMALNGSRPATLEVEMEYETIDGKKVHDSDSALIQILSRNEVVYTSLRPEDAQTFAEQFDYSPALMTAMTTPADPVVQQLSGRINSMAAETFNRTIAVSASDEECIAFMSTIWQFMQQNKIAYQSPFGNETDGKLGQHVKFTRDVLRNKAGTCIDLSITWASICEAAGLEPAIIIIPGHAFPAIKLPKSQKWLAVESTMLKESFLEALKMGDQELQQAVKGDHYLIEISPLRKQGVLGLDLSNVSENYLNNLGYTFEATPVNVNPAIQEEEVDVTTTNFNPNGENIPVNRIVGQWGGYGKENGRPTWVGVALNGDASFEILYIYNNDDGEEVQETVDGTWCKMNGSLVLNTTGGNRFEYEFEFTGTQLKFQVLGGTQVVTLDAIR